MFSKGNVDLEYTYSEWELLQVCRFCDDEEQLSQYIVGIQEETLGVIRVAVVQSPCQASSTKRNMNKYFFGDFLSVDYLQSLRI